MKNQKEKQNQLEALFEKVIESYRPALWRVVLTFESDKEQQKELFQDILFAVWKSLANFQGLSEVQTYIYRVAHNTAFAYLQKQIKKVRVTENETQVACESLDPENTHSRQQHIDLLSSAIRRLPISERQLVALSLEGLSYPQIAEIVGLNANQVGVYLARARAKLKKYLKEK